MAGLGKGQPEDKKGKQQRVKTGVPRLDFITKGGLLKGASYAIVGPPGSGKTVLANQIAFNHVKEGGRALYVTLLSESHARMLANIEEMTFFDPSAIPDKLHYISGHRSLETEGLKGLLELVRRSAQQHEATLLVIDGMDVAQERAGSDLALKRFMHDVQAFASILGCTTLLLSPHGEEGLRPETTAVDGVFQLTHWLSGPRAVRELITLKFRGSDSLLGRHEVEIGEDGLVIHPRTEVHFSDPRAYGEERRIRMPFGVPRLDESLRGGLLSGSTTVLLGAPGTGKTVLGLQFLAEGARQGQPGFYFGFYETPPRLMEKAAGVGMKDLPKHVKSGLVEIQWQPPLEHNLDSLAELLLERLHERKAERLRLFIDGVEGFRAATVYPDRMGRFLSALSHQLRLLDATTLFSEETPLISAGVDLPHPELAAYVENIILLRYVELRSQLYRLISIMKMRESQYDSGIREFSITDKGIEVAESFRSAEAILTGHARLRDDEPPAKEIEPPMGSRAAAGKKGKRRGLLRRRKP